MTLRSRVFRYRYRIETRDTPTPIWAADGGNGSVVPMSDSYATGPARRVTDRLLEAYGLWCDLPDYEKTVMWMLVRAEMKENHGKKDRCD